MKHGGDLLRYQEAYDGELVDFSSNINPLGPPPGLKEKIMEGLDSLSVYPDIHYRALRRSVADYLQCDVQNVLLGNGSVELIDLFVFLAKRVVLCIPSFSEYELRAQIHQKRIHRIPYKDDFTLDLPTLYRNLKEGDLLILGNPNNPTGLRINKETLLDLYEKVKQAGAFLLLDEAFFEFCPRDYDSISCFSDDRYAQVAVLRAATKFFALPGLRLGYGCASPEVAEQIKRLQLPWSINALADIAGRFIFEDKAYLQRSRAYIKKERDYLLSELSPIQGLHVFPTQANFILIKLDHWSEEEALAHFLQEGLLIRPCSSFPGLDSRTIRVAIKDRVNNDRLLHAFKKLERKAGGENKGYT